MSVIVLPPMSVALCLFLPPRTSHTGPFKNDFDFIYLWLCWAIAALHGLSLVADYRLLVVVTPWLRSAASRTCGLQLLRQVGSVAAAPGLSSSGSMAGHTALSCSTTCGIFPDEGSKLCLLCKQAGSLPLSHQGSPSRCAELYLFISFPPPRGQKGARFISGLDARLNPGPCQIWWVDR